MKTSVDRGRKMAQKSSSDQDKRMAGLKTLAIKIDVNSSTSAASGALQPEEKSAFHVLKVVVRDHCSAASTSFTEFSSVPYGSFGLSRAPYSIRRALDHASFTHGVFFRNVMGTVMLLSFVATPGAHGLISYLNLMLFHE